MTRRIPTLADLPPAVRVAFQTTLAALSTSPASGDHPMTYAIVDALGTYAGPNTTVHRTCPDLATARSYVTRRPRFAIVAVGPDERDYMVPGYRFRLTYDMVIART